MSCLTHGTTNALSLCMKITATEKVVDDLIQDGGFINIIRAEVALALNGLESDDKVLGYAFKERIHALVDQFESNQKELELNSNKNRDDYEV